MKKLVVFLLIAAVTAGAAFADPIGLKVYLDGFSFGNVAGDDYKFSGEGGEASFTPGIEYGTSFLDDSLALTAGLQDEVVFSDPLEQDVRLNVNVGYNLQLAPATKLVLSVWDFFHLLGGNDKFADADLGQVKTRIGVGVQLYQVLGFGVAWTILDVEFHKSFAKGSELGITTGEDNNFAVGVNSNFGLYGLAGFGIAFNDAGAATVGLEKAGVYGTTLRVGYITGNIDGRVSVEIPLFEDGVDFKGISIVPRFTYSNIIPGLEAYLDLAVSGIASKKYLTEAERETLKTAVESGNDVSKDQSAVLTLPNGKIGFTPTIGVSYSF
ncbi:MAG: hypothetical protein LBF77_06220 [Spirochaetaceae bacterium]|jgi:hypothetical protein|nr:hypothetical protein [Spirochaetaceae bacterium]